MINSLDRNIDGDLKYFFIDYARNEYFRGLNTEYGYRIDTQRKFIEDYKKYFQYSLVDNTLTGNVLHSSANWDKLVMRLLRQPLVL